MANSVQHSFISGRDVRPLELSAKGCEHFQDLKRIGYAIDEAVARKMYRETYANDALPNPVTTPSIPTFAQFLQNWLPGNVEVVTAARNIDLIVGIATSGNFVDEEIVQGILEQLGTSVPYSDFGNLPLSSWNWNVERRTVVRQEEGMRVGILEEGRAAAIRVNSGQEKRNAAALALEISRNKIGFNGFNSGDNRTYGLLNDPSLPAYVPVVNGGGGNPEWSTKTFAEIQKDIQTAITALRTNSKGVIDPKTTPITYALATSVVDFLATTTDFGISVMDWLNKNYPMIRVVSAPELDNATSGDNAAYMFAEKVAGTGTDDNATFIQVVPTRFMVTGVQKLVKGYEEGYAMATAGVMCKRPYAVYRQSGM